MKRKREMLAGLLWIVLQNGLLAQGSLYPGRLHLVLPANSLPMQRTGKEVSEFSARACCEKLAGDRRRIYYLTAWNNRIVMQVNGVYGREGILFMKILLINRSDIDYTVDSLRFIIRSSQHETGEDRLMPFFVYGNVKMIKAQSRELCVFVLPNFALPGKKHLDIELLEKHGGRNLRLKVGKRPLLHARFV